MPVYFLRARADNAPFTYCLLYTSDAADDLLCVDLGGRRIITKKNNHHNPTYDNIHLFV